MKDKLMILLIEKYHEELCRCYDDIVENLPESLKESTPCSKLNFLTGELENGSIEKYPILMDFESVIDDIEEDIKFLKKG